MPEFAGAEPGRKMLIENPKTNDPRPGLEPWIAPWVLSMFQPAGTSAVGAAVR